MAAMLAMSRSRAGETICTRFLEAHDQRSQAAVAPPSSCSMRSRWRRVEGRHDEHVRRPSCRRTDRRPSARLTRHDISSISPSYSKSRPAPASSSPPPPAPAARVRQAGGRNEENRHRHARLEHRAGGNARRSEVAISARSRVVGISEIAASATKIGCLRDRMTTLTTLWLGLRRSCARLPPGAIEKLRVTLVVTIPSAYSRATIGLQRKYRDPG